MINDRWIGYWYSIIFHNWIEIEILAWVNDWQQRLNSPKENHFLKVESADSKKFAKVLTFDLVPWSIVLKFINQEGGTNEDQFGVLWFDCFSVYQTTMSLVKN